MLPIFNRKLLVMLRGGLGNQLFIYTASQKIAKDLNISKIKYIYNFDVLKNFTSIDFFIKNINIQKAASNKYFDSIKNFTKYFFFYKVIKDDVTKNEIKFWQKNFAMDGYFQNKYWYKSELFKIIEKIFSSKIKKKLRDIKMYDVVISLRRGDYVDLGWALDLNYYYSAIKKLKIKKKEKIKIICKDKPMLRKLENYLYQKGYQIEKNKKFNLEKRQSLEDFFSIIKSKKLIMSNSSFCWWGAVCRKNLDLSSKNVIFPKFWLPKNVRVEHPKNCHPGNPLGWLGIDNAFEGESN